MWGWYGLVIYVVVAIVGICYAVKVERHKKQLDIQMYKEIVAFTEGKSLSEIEKARESSKRIYQKVLLGIGSGVLVLIVCGLMARILG